MRIMILGDDQSPHTIKWVNALSESHNTICLVSFHRVDKSLYHEHVEIVTINVLRDNISSIDFLKFGYLRLVRIVKKQLKEFHPDILHAYYASSYGLIGAMSGFKPFVISVWGSDVFEFPKKSFIHKAILKHNLKQADYIQSTSKVMAEELKKYTSKLIVVVPFGIDMVKYKPIRKKDLSQGDETLVIGTVKWLQKVYGINYLIDAFHIILKKYPSKKLKLLIVGGGPLLKEYQEKVRNYGMDNFVEFTGTVNIEETAKYHNQIDIFAVLSLRESFGVSALEAAASGVPTIVSNVGGLPEVVQDGKTGIIVEPENPQAAADAISKLIDDEELRIKMGLNAREFVKAKYDWDKNVQDQIEIYNRVRQNQPLIIHDNKPSICHITTVHQRFDVRIFYKECTSLSRNYDVNLIVADGKGDEIKNDICIYDIGLRKDSRIKRAFVDSKKALKKAIDLDCDIYHFHDPELIIAGKKLLKKGKMVIYDVHEDLPRQIYGKPYLVSFMKPLVSQLIELIENRYAHRMSYIITATPYIAERFKKVNSKTIDINNFPITKENKNPKPYDDKEDCISYVGGIFENRGVYELIESLKYSKVILHLAGEFETKDFFEKCKSSFGWKYVTYYGFVSRKEVANILNMSKIGIVSLYPLRNYLDSLPIKMFEYMLAGIPVIASDFPYWKRIVEEEKCGVNVNPKDPEEIAEKTLQLISTPELAAKMGLNGRNAVLERYNWCIEEKKILEVYKKLLR